MSARPAIPVAGRRARLARRHRLVPGHRAEDVVAAAESMVCLHAELRAVEVDLDAGGRTGYLLPDDLKPTEPVAPCAALLPPLDPTTMGWFERDWYLGPYKEQLFDTTGNGGPAVWWDGRIVDGWRQGEDGGVELQMLEDVGSEALGAIELEAARLTEWFGGTRVLPRFPSPLSKAVAEASR